MKNIIIVLFILLALGLVKWLFLGKSDEQGGGGKKGMGNSGPIDVTAFVAKAEKLENKLFVTGTTLANEEAALMPEISGKIISLNIKEGTAVTKSELLVKINDADLQAQLKKLRSQEGLAKEKESRLKKLLDINGVSKDEYETAENVLSSLQADIEFTQAQIAKTEIRAPFSGWVGLKNISEGSYVSPAITIASIQQVDPIKIDFSVPEKYAPLVQPGGLIRFFIEGSEAFYEAKIMAVEPKIDLSTRTVKVRAICANKDGKIIPGSFAKVELILKASENSLMVPSEALIPVLKGYKVFVARSGKAQEVNVTAGLRSDKQVQVIQGLQQGDTIITSGIMQLKADSPIKIISVK